MGPNLVQEGFFIFDGCPGRLHIIPGSICQPFFLNFLILIKSLYFIVADFTASMLETSFFNISQSNVHLLIIMIIMIVIVVVIKISLAEDSLAELFLGIILRSKKAQKRTNMR